MNTVKFLLQRVVLLAVVVFGIVACGGGTSKPTAGGSTITTLSGTAATGAAIAGAQITIKGANNLIVTPDTNLDGTYTADISTLNPPYLLKVSDPNNANSYLFSVATAAGTANIHPFTDLIVRNWYMASGSTVEAQFTGTLNSTILPTVEGIKTIDAVIRNVLATSFANANVPPDFNLITSPFVVNSPGVNSPFDLVLDQTRVVIDPTNGASPAVTIQAVDTNTGTTSTLLNTTLSTDLTIAPAPDNTNPTDPGIPVLAATNNSILVKWAASTDAVGVVRYNIYKNGVVFDTSPFPAYLDEGLAPSTSYCYQIKAADAAGLLSAIVPATATESCITTRADPDIAAPAAPTGLAATASVSQGQIDLTWVASIDQDTVGYDIYRDTVSGTVKVATTAGTSYSNTGLAANTLYSYTVKARDAAGNPSGASNSASATTAAGTPSFPKGVAAVAGNAQVTISWSPVSGATSYNVYTGTVSGFSKISVTPVSVASSPSVQTPLNNGTTHFFVITAVNDLGESISSAQVQATPTSGTILADMKPAFGIMSPVDLNAYYASVVSTGTRGPITVNWTQSTGLVVNDVSITYTWTCSVGGAGGEFPYTIHATPATGATTASIAAIPLGYTGGCPNDTSAPTAATINLQYSVDAGANQVVSQSYGTANGGSAPPISGLVGSWSNVTGGWGPPGTDLEFTFFANGDYIQAQSVADGTPFTQPGLEHGTYTWNSATGAFTAACPTVDTNLQAGFSALNGVQCNAGTTVMSTTVTVIGNTMTIIDNSSVPPATITLSRVVDANNAIVGSWAFPGNTSVELTFFANGDYMQAQSVANNIPTIEQPGLEHGTYTWNSATGAFTAACPTVDTNLQAGFSHPAVTGVGCAAGTTVMSTTVTVNGNTMTLIDNSESPPATRTLSRVN